MKSLVEWFNKKFPSNQWEMDPNHKIVNREIPPVDMTNFNMSLDRRLEIIDNFMNWEPILAVPLPLVGKFSPDNKVRIQFPPTVFWFVLSFWGLLGIS